LKLERTINEGAMGKKEEDEEEEEEEESSK
jgi:hypothetical protein